LNRWIQRLYNVVVVLMAIFVVWGFWNNYEKTKLNQQYERLIEQFEESRVQFEEVIRDLQAYRDRQNQANVAE
jgi:predicted negative regulator of RcsB-dependent stress response